MGKPFAAIAAMIVVFFVASAAMAQDDDVTSQTSEADAPVEATFGDMTLEACQADLADCQNQLGEDSNLLGLLAANRGQTVDEMLASDCRSRRGTWQDGQCLCAEPNEWFTAETQECCVLNPRAYLRQQSACAESSGTHYCRGGCRCPMGTQLLDGRCVGEAASREEIERLRARLPELETERDRVQTDLEAAQAAGGDQAEHIAQLEEQLVEMDAEISSLRRLRDEQQRSIEQQSAMIAALGGVPPAPYTPPEPLPESDGEDEGSNWCTRNGWACAGIIVGAIAAVAGATAGVVCATGHCGPDEIRANWYR